MIQGVSSGGHVGVVAITALRYAQSDGHAVVMPVRPAQMIYANFKHIQVRPDSRLEDGVPLYKLKILDSLIDQMAKTGAEGGTHGTARPGITASNIDGMILSLAGAGRGGSGLGSAYRAGFFPPPGAFVDLVA
jgi:hypothetical protein